MQMPSKIKKQFFGEISKKMSIYYNDESGFEKNKKVWRIICRKWEKAVWRLEEQLHKWTNIIWSYRTDWELVYNLTKKKDTKAFLKHLKYLRKKEKKKWIIMILDNASIHKTKVVREYCKRNNIKLVYLPAYSPEYNYIEKIWKMIKKEFGKLYWKYKDTKTAIKWVISKMRYYKRFKWVDIIKYINII